MLPTLSPQEFVHKWRKASLKERSAAQEHFIDLCHLVGHQTPAEADPEGLTFTFEAGATKSTGGQGWADVWKRNYFAWEYKGKHKDLDQAYQQLLQYRESLLNPPLLIVSDLDQILIHTSFTNTVKRVIPLQFDDLLTPDGLAQLRAVFFDPQTFRAPVSTDQVTQEAATQFARLADLLRASGAEPEQGAHFLIRLLFCLFAEDIELLPKDLFTRLAKQTQNHPDAFAAQLRQLFGAMSAGGWFGADQVAHFDGRLFDDDTVIPLDRHGLDILVQVATLDWSSIEPSVFGTLFERSLDPSKRSQLGAHYTSREDILLIVEPALMAPLRRRWEEVQGKALDLARRRDGAKTNRTRNNRQKDLTKVLLDFSAEIAQIHVLDPACGSGNFLYVALKQLLDLEKQVVTLAGNLGIGRFFPSVSPVQLHGIEINAYAHQLAQATIWIGYIQWLRQNGFGFPAAPILKPLDTILHMDAILAFDKNQQPFEPLWPDADVVIGNPPFLGGNRIRQELGDTYVADLFALYQDRVPALADLVCYWFEKTRAQIQAGTSGRAGLLATQAIRSDANRHVLERIKATGDIFWAQSDREWVLEGADVRVSMVGFDGGKEDFRELDDQPVAQINSDLTSTLDLTIAQRLRQNTGLAFVGSQKIGPFDIPVHLARRMLDATGNPNGRPNTDVVRPSVNGSDIMGNSRNMWIIDFGVQMDEYEASQYETPFEYVKERVYPIRITNRRPAYAKRWWRHGEARPGMRTALKGLTRFIVTSRVAKHRVFAWLSPPALPDHKLCVLARDDDFFFGVLHSRIHEVWSLSTGSRHGVGNDPVYSVWACFTTFPFPWPPGRDPKDDPRVEAIAEAAQELVEKRDAWLNPDGATERELKKRTLTNLYNQRPTWLDLAHRKLDQAVFNAYGWPHDLTEEEMLERLLVLNLQRAGG